MSGSTLGGKVAVLIGGVDLVVVGVVVTLVAETDVPVLMSVVLTGLPALGSLGSQKPGGIPVGTGLQ